MLVVRMLRRVERDRGYAKQTHESAEQWQQCVRFLLVFSDHIEVDCLHFVFNRLHMSLLLRFEPGASIEKNNALVLDMQDNIYLAIAVYIFELGRQGSLVGIV